MGSWLSPYHPPTLKPSELSCLVQLWKDWGTLTASPLCLLWPPLFKVQGSGIPWAQRRKGGSCKNWASVPSGECKPWPHDPGPPSDPHWSEPAALTSLAPVESVEALSLIPPPGDTHLLHTGWGTSKASSQYCGNKALYPDCRQNNHHPLMWGFLSKRLSGQFDLSSDSHNHSGRLRE